MLDKLYKYLGLVLSYFSELSRPPLEARGKATSLTKKAFLIAGLESTLKKEKSIYKNSNLLKWKIQGEEEVCTRNLISENDPILIGLIFNIFI